METAAHRWMLTAPTAPMVREAFDPAPLPGEVVVEVAYNEIQRSPHYSSGFALRFARITRIRDDKDPQQATTLADLRALYDRQFLSKSRRDP